MKFSLSKTLCLWAAVASVLLRSCAECPAQTTGWPQSIEFTVTNVTVMHVCSNNISPVIFQPNYQDPITNIVIATNYQGTIQFGTSLYTVKELTSLGGQLLEAHPVSVEWQWDYFRDNNRLAESELAFTQAFQKTNTNPQMIPVISHTITRLPEGRELGFSSDGAVVWRKAP